MRLYLLRHGQTEENLAKIVQGQRQGNLTSLGHEQAALAAKRLQDEKFDVIIVSDLRRTLQTAKPILKGHPEALVVKEPRVRECSLGVYEGRPWGHLVEDAKAQSIDLLHFKPEGGESRLEFKERVQEYKEYLFKQYAAKSVLLISHGGFIANLLLQLLDAPPDAFDEVHPPNCALSIIGVHDDAKHSIELINCIKHL